ncbi:MAG: DUF3365 domain-containing protein [Campylobacterales bacterium]|nr:DUF3365 domain-containing protein [Campylobacterales bacterium]
MKLQTILLSALLATSLFAADQNATAPMTTKQEGVQYIKMLGEALKSQLQAQMKADPSGMSALGFCTAKAMEITKEVNQKLPTYASVRRTALKTRNEGNAPDAIDTQVMQDYEKAIADKTFTPTDIKVVEEGNVTRLYKPLITEAPCLKCHGTQLSPDIQASLKVNYTKDQATGFTEGSLRGVIVAEIKKH